MKPRKHAELIRAWADGAVIQYWNDIGRACWIDCEDDRPEWYGNVQYRVKPEKLPDEVRYMKAGRTGAGEIDTEQKCWHNLKLIFCGNTGILKDSVVIFAEGERDRLKRYWE
jgi:hypothetical protein